MNPVIPWVGSKRWLAATIREYYMPGKLEGKWTHIEPFAGGAALFFQQLPARSILSDVNEDLILFYQALKHDHQALASLVGTYPRTKEFYLAMRKILPTADLERAARFYYLLKHAYGYLWRVNKKGFFNAPWSDIKVKVGMGFERFEEASKALANTTLICSDFRDTIALAGEGDFVYCDPPYTFDYSQNTFKYAGFSSVDRRDLAACLCAASDRGAKVLISDAHCYTLTTLYRHRDGWRIHEVGVPQKFDKSKETVRKEALVSNY